MRLSVIIPGYNTPENWWRRCLASVLSAIGQDDEVICVDDGSKVPVNGFWQNLGIDDKRVKLITLKTNSGLPAARNEGLKVATGKYVAFVDSDDELKHDVYEESIRVIEKYQSDIAVYGVNPIWINNGLCKHDVVEEHNLGVLSAEQLAWLFKACLFDYAWNKVYRRSFLDEKKLRFDEKARTGEDTVFNCHCVIANARWCTVNIEGIVYYRYDGTMLSRYVPNMRDTQRRKLEARAACRASRPGLDELLGDNVEVTEEILDHAEWLNMWTRQSPHSYAERWRFLAHHRHLARKGLMLEFVRRLVYSWLRQHCYIRPIRRWNIKRTFPNVQEWRQS